MTSFSLSNENAAPTNTSTSTTCSVCQREFRSTSALRYHLLTHGEKKFQCETCNYRCYKKGALASHMKYKHEMILRKRNDPRRVLSPSTGVHSVMDEDSDSEDNVMSMEVSTNITCDICQRGFKTKSALQYHILTHTEKKLQCEVEECDYRCHGMSALGSHMRRMHNADLPRRNDAKSVVSPSKLKRFLCEDAECGAELSSVSALNRHRKSHFTGEMAFPYTCLECLQGYRTKQGLSRHEQSKHDSAKLFPCSECNYAATALSHLKYHTSLKHTKEKPFKCSYKGCPYASAVKFALNAHMKTHDVEQRRGFTCWCCQHWTMTGRAMRAHLATHCGEDEKTFACPTCGLSFRQKCHMKSHLATHDK